MSNTPTEKFTPEKRKEYWRLTGFVDGIACYKKYKL
jgi:hypothetical protein